MDLEAHFRREHTRLVSRLTATLGSRHLPLAEDVASEALLRAMKSWSFHGVPEHPQAWLWRTAKHLAIDHLRRDRRLRPMEDVMAGESKRDTELDEYELMKGCCQPGLPPVSQLALILRELCGFNAREIAAMLLVREDAMQQRLVRATRAIAESGWVEGSSSSSIPVVARALYLLFNEGYKARTGPELIRAECCHQAIRLAHLMLSQDPSPLAHALLSLMYFHASRLAARTDESGRLVRLEDQDRSRWDRAMISRAFDHLAAASEGPSLSSYHIEAAIAAEHARAPDYGSTKWKLLLSHYDALVQLTGSPVAELNRCVVLRHVCGVEAALEELERLAAEPALQGSHLLPATLGQMLELAGRRDEAREQLQRAAALATCETEKLYLVDCLHEMDLPGP